MGRGQGAGEGAREGQGKGRVRQGVGRGGQTSDRVKSGEILYHICELFVPS